MSKLLDTLPKDPLDRETEFELAARIQKHQCESDKNELTMSAMRQAIPYMRKCCRGKLSEGELYSLAYAGLLKAAKNFRPGSLRFIGYAKPYLRGEISREWKSRDVVKSASLHESKPEYLKAKHDVEDRSNAWTIEKGDPLPDSVEPEFELIELHEKWSFAEPIIAHCLNEHERTVLALHYSGGLSFEEISAMLVPRVSRSAVEAVHSRALRKVRNTLFRDKKLYL